MKILSFDPSGNYNEGKGTTGYAVSLDKNLPHKLGDIKASDFTSRQAYWAAHRDLIEQEFPEYVVIEDYKLFGHKLKEQVGSALETPQLIGYMEMVCYDLNIPVVYQSPSTKQRFADNILKATNIIEMKGTDRRPTYYYKGELTNLHMRDALRHNLYFCRFGKELKS